MTLLRKIHPTTLKALPLIAVLSALFLTGCERKPLYLRVNEAKINVAVYDVRLELLWGIDWESKWQYQWDGLTKQYGPIGYSKPENVRATVYNLDPVKKNRRNYFTRNFNINGGRVSLIPGSWYDMLFFNSGTEYILLNQSEKLDYYNASTRTSSLTSYLRADAAAPASDRQMPESAGPYTDYNQPDELFGVMLGQRYISDDPNEYSKEIDEDGQVVYIYNILADLSPYTCIYLYQIMVINNNDSLGARIKGADGVSVTGMAQGTDLFTRNNWHSTASVTSNDIKPMQSGRNLNLPDGTSVKGDIMACRMLTWGLPGIDPVRTVTRASRAVVEDRNYIGIGLTLRNGYIYNITRDITDQMHESPAGGVITIVVDAGSIPDEVLKDRPGPQGGGGFNAKVEDWNKEVDAEIVI